ncbi:RNA polymerase sigma factor [Sphingobacterium paludis]|uniref:RNA polymerase sigma-70 factor (ECF subfamily) n=1 Tax=Sphingobacterium paludis TaxID=1476465 RepID=A0A4R7CX49_9SPHI|nr:sigma-70 family RNA polymerase sigma factor [Sphingobacterium paludis]TDS12477.1 RNA polymerase sigma-70 factor (ECF subfamily) [Sphingobacterium paludis]
MEKTLLSLFVSGDKKAFEQVYRCYSERVFKRLLYLLKDEDEAEELLQNVFVKFWTNRAAIAVEKNVANYLLRMSDSMAIDLLRRNISRKAVYDHVSLQTNTTSNSVEDTFMQKEEQKILEQAVNLLPPQRKLIFTLCKMEGRSYGEVGEILGISPATVSNHLVLAMKQIRTFASQYNNELKALLFFPFLDNL